MGEPKLIDLTEFRELGFIMEINRKVLHPVGLALSVDVDEEGKTTGFAGVWDYRDDPEGIVFGDDQFEPDDQAKSDAIAAARASKIDARRAFGCDDTGEQPIPKAD